jgi:hypothetical protein
MRLGTQQQRVLCLMASNKGELTALRKRGEDARIARSLISHGLVVDERTVEGSLYHPRDGEKPWPWEELRITDDGRKEADRIRAGRPEICSICDKNPAEYVAFTGAQTGEEVGYPSAHVYCAEDVPDYYGRLYRLVRVTDGG